MNSAQKKRVAELADQLSAIMDEIEQIKNDETPKGDVVDVCIIGEDSPCPVCSQLVPLIMYCPECGKRIDTTEVKE